jgi:tRNA(Met) C34 N-acetyltransferase TmcA
MRIGDGRLLGLIFSRATGRPSRCVCMGIRSPPIIVFLTIHPCSQYIQPQDSHVLGQAELLIIDEAAAIPLPLVRKLLGPYLVFMASTINGYEGTGRSLSIKLIQQLREQTRPTISASANNMPIGSSGKAAASTGKLGTGLARTLTEIKLDQPIRYGLGDPVEKWLNALLYPSRSLGVHIHQPANSSTSIGILCSRITQRAKSSSSV